MLETSVVLKVRVERMLATVICKIFESKKMTISEGLAAGLAEWLGLIGETELAAMIKDGRGLIPRQPLRHRQITPKAQKPEPERPGSYSAG